MARVIDGKVGAAQVRGQVRLGAEAFHSQFGRAPGLDVILVGDDAASAVYVRNKEKAAEEVGFRGKVHRLPANTSESEVLSLVAQLNETDEVDGILVQFPVPSHIRQDAVIAAISPAKDVDGLHPINMGRLWSGLDGLVSCTPAGCIWLLEQLGVKLAGMRAVVLGRSQLVGKPIAALLLQKDCTVTVAHSKTQDLEAVCREADILIAAVGRPELVRGSWIKPGAIVIDVGINRTPSGKLVGDVAYAEAFELASAITPVPGGVGPMTIAMLLNNTLIAAKRRKAAG
jgi:methylenetetrahydrofolate dehydrogenase (NADP+) / methenyltetrahydrofolate cyclohydrolase